MDVRGYDLGLQRCEVGGQGCDVGGQGCDVGGQGCDVGGQGCDVGGQEVRRRHQDASAPLPRQGCDGAAARKLSATPDPPQPEIAEMDQSTGAGKCR